MALVKPFKALRFTDEAGKISELCCPPYDIISEEQRAAFLKANKNNIIRLELPRETKNPYKKASSTLSDWLENGILKVDQEACIYIYEEEFSVGEEVYKLRGFISRIKLEEFSKKIILPHEETLSKAKEDRFELMKATGCNFSQIYSLYSDPENLVERILNKFASADPDTEFCDGDGVIHRLWAVPRCDQTDKLSVLMAGNKLYIADGHHRYETALRYRDYLYEKGEAQLGGDADYIMMMLVNMQNPGLVVFPTHRIIHDVKGFSSNKLLTACKEYFTVENTSSRDTAEKKLNAAYNDNKKAFIFYDGKKYSVLTLNDNAVMKKILPEKSADYCNLDVSILHTLILGNILGIDAQKLADGTNVTYTRDKEEAYAAAESTENNCCFIINPTRISEIGAIAANGEKMPQKSTYFYPKLITGLVMNKIL